MNEYILKIARQNCQSQVESSPEAQKVIAKINVGFAKVQKKAGYELFAEIELLPWDLVGIYADRMFRMGFELGQNPAAIIDLPNVDQEDEE